MIDVEVPPDVVDGFIMQPPDEEEIFTPASLGITEKQEVAKSLTSHDVLKSKFRRADDLITNDPPKIDWIVENAIEAGGLPVIFGDSGIGKSWLAMHLADCVATGRPWFGKTCKKRTVLYLDGECGEGLIHRRAQAVCHLGGDLTFISFPDFTLDDGGLETIEWLIQETGAELLILDPLMNFLSGDENSIEDIKPQLVDLHEVGHSLGCATLAVHHENRAKGYRGSSGIKDICTLMLHLVVSRVGNGDFEHVLDAKVEKQREATLRDFSLVWFVEDGKFHAGGLDRMRETPTALLANACQELCKQGMGWPGKDQLIKAKELHGMAQKRASEALAQAVLDNVLEYKVGKHNRHEIRVVGLENAEKASS